MSDKIIKTAFRFPLVPIKSQWQSWVEDDPEGAQGWGATEAEAIEDLKEKLAELEYTKEE